MGMGVVGLGVLGLSLLLIVYSKIFGVSDQMSLNQVITVITGFHLVHLLLHFLLALVVVFIQKLQMLALT